MDAKTYAARAVTAVAACVPVLDRARRVSWRAFRARDQAQSSRYARYAPSIYDENRAMGFVLHGLVNGVNSLEQEAAHDAAMAELVPILYDLQDLVGAIFPPMMGMHACDEDVMTTLMHLAKDYGILRASAVQVSAQQASRELIALHEHLERLGAALQSFVDNG